MIVNLTQHAATQEQIDQGVVDLSPHLQKRLKELLTFETLPTKSDIVAVAFAIAEFARGAYKEKPQQAMIGGAPWLMAELERRLLAHGIEPVYAFSVRESVDEIQGDGSVRKVSVFRHQGFVRN